MVEMDLFSISVRSGKNPRPAVVPPSPVRYALRHHHHHRCHYDADNDDGKEEEEDDKLSLTTVMMTLVHVHFAKLALPSNSLMATPKLHISRHLKAKYKNTHCPAIKGRNTNVKKLQYKISTTFKWNTQTQGKQNNFMAL